MKVGDYVRTPLGITKYIGKYDNYEGFYEFDKLDEELWTGDIANVVYTCEIDNIVLKSSPNIIDLIEVGDYVNGFRVNDSTYGLIIIAPTTDIWEMNSTKDEFKNNNLFVEKIYKLEDIEIKSVITKEQFESMEYKVDD